MLNEQSSDGPRKPWPGAPSCAPAKLRAGTRGRAQFLEEEVRKEKNGEKSYVEEQKGFCKPSFCTWLF